jgi:hypothetical protein
MRTPDEVFDALATSSFRRRFRLHGRELDSLRAKGLSVVLVHARDFIATRLTPAAPVQDGQ